MRVLFIRHSEPLPIDSKSERLLRTGQMVEYFDDKGICVEWLTASFNHFKRRQRKAGKYNIFNRSILQVIKTPGYKRNIGVGRLIDHFMFGVKASYHLLKKDDYDCVISSFPTITSTFLISIICKIKGINMVVDYRDKWPEVFYMNQKGVKKVFIKAACQCLDLLCRISFINSSKVLCPTCSYCDYVTETYSLEEGKCLESPLGYKKECFDNCSEVAEYDILNREWEQRLIFAGTLGYMFDFETFLEVASKPSSRNKLFILCGEGERYNELKSRFSSCSNILFTGWVDKRTLDYLLKKSDIALAPYLNIGNFVGHVPNKILEYMSYGLPIITCLEGETRSIVKTLGGEFYKQGDVGSFSKAIREHENKSKSALDSNEESSLKVFHEKYSYDVVYRRIIEMIAPNLTVLDR